MAFEHEIRQASHLLTAIEDGMVSADDVRHLAEEADPALVYLLLGWLRARYRPGHSASEGVLGRIVGLMQGSRQVARAVKSAESDPIVQWFEESYDYRDLDRRDFVALVVDKLES
jgi:hypothetical protein